MMRFLFMFFIISISFSAQAGRIRLRKVKDAPRSCQLMKEESSLTRTNRKILGTEKNSVVIDDTVSVVGDLGNKLCEWPKEKFSEIGEDVKKMSFYIDEFKNILVVYQKSDKQKSMQQVHINLDNCQFDQLRTLSEVSLPKCDPPKKAKKSKSRKKKKS